MARLPSDCAFRGRTLRFHGSGDALVDVVDADGNFHPGPDLQELATLLDQGWHHFVDVLWLRYQINRAEVFHDPPQSERGYTLSFDPCPCVDCAVFPEPPKLPIPRNERFEDWRTRTAALIEDHRLHGK